MNNDDMLRLFQRPLTPRPEAIKEAERILSENAKRAIQQAQEKRLRKRRKAIDAAIEGKK